MLCFVLYESWLWGLNVIDLNMTKKSLFFRYGKVFKSHLFGSPTIVSCDFEFNMYILQNEGTLFPVDYPKVMHNILGKFSLLLVKGDLHRKLRSTIISFVSATKHESNFLHCVEMLALSRINSWIPISKQVAFYEEAKRVWCHQFANLFLLVF